MSVKVAINGFGRIGRLAFRQMFGAEGYEVVAINDLTSPKMLAHLLKYDSSQGRYVNFGEEDQVTADDEAGTITVKGKTIKIYKEPDANNCPWGEIGVDVVLECSGFYTSKAKAQAHINAGANSTGAAKAIGLVIPELNGKLIGAAQRVPTPTGSTTILNAVVAKKVTVDEVNAAMKAAATESFGYNTEQIVSSDIVGMRFGSLFDATQTMVNELPNGGCQVQVVSWYDNENSYTSQMVRTIKYFAELN